MLIKTALVHRVLANMLLYLKSPANTRLIMSPMKATQSREAQRVERPPSRRCNGVPIALLAQQFTDQRKNQIESVQPLPDAFLASYLEAVAQGPESPCKLAGRTPEGTYLLQIPLSKESEQRPMIAKWIAAYERRESLRSWPDKVD